MRKNMIASFNRRISGILLSFILLVCMLFTNPSFGQIPYPELRYTVSVSDLRLQLLHVELSCSGWQGDTVEFRMPEWMPGYYQIMDYGEKVQNFSARGNSGENLQVITPNHHTWQVKISKGKPFTLSYEVKADQRFVASNWLDSDHVYIVPAGTFLYIRDHIKNPVGVKVIPEKKWKKIATGLEPLPGKENEFSAPDFDILYDCPILAGDLEEFPPFEINGVKHRFLAYNPGKFNRERFMINLKKAVQAGVDIIGEVPYTEYTFIGIGQGRGGIEHLNNATVSFDGSGMDNDASMTGMINFLSHEYFHNYNVKRIRPYELGPFDYDREDRTNLLWVAEGLTVYYEYLTVKRAGLVNKEELFSDFESNINALENNPGRFYQSLVQSSYYTWSDGPFGRQGKDAGKTISYYDKGPLIGWILDLTIRNNSGNKKSLDDVMRFLYQHYYKLLQRGFTDAEFQQACETIAGTSLSAEFEYVNTTKEIDYNKYLSYAGLKLTEEKNSVHGFRKFTIIKETGSDTLQKEILSSWLGE